MTAHANIPARAFASPLDGALWAIGQGLCVAPCHADDPAEPERGKVAILNDWPTLATNDEAQVQTWAREHPGCNWLIEPGRTGSMVADLDCKNGKNGVAAFDALCKEHGFEIGDTLVVRTPSGGFHIYLAGLAPNSTSKLGDGIDIKSTDPVTGKAGYVLCPGSVVGGKPYVIERDCDAALLAVAPPKLIELASVKRHEPQSAPRDVEQDLAGNVARFADYLKRQAPPVKGSRDNDAFKHACVGHEQGVSDETCFEMLLGWLSRDTTPGSDPDKFTADNLAEKVRSAYGGNAQNGFASYAVAPGAETFGDFAASQPDQPSTDAQSTEKSRFKGMLYDEYSQLAPPELLFKELNLPKFGVGFVNAEMEAFKTFLVGGKVALALARGRDFNFGSGRALTVNEDCQGAAFLFLGEAPNGVATLRLPALFDAAGIPEKERGNVPLVLIPDVPRIALGEDDEAREVIAEIHRWMKRWPKMRVALVVFDTLSKMLGGMDMNASKDMTTAIAIAERVQREFQCCVAVLHHVSADDPERGHGSRTVGRDVDFNAFVERRGKALACRWRNGKDKDEGMGDTEIYFEMVPHMRSLVPEVVTLARYMKLVGGRGMSDGELMLAALVGLGCYPEGTFAAMPGNPTTGCAERALARAMQRLDGYAPLAPGEKPTVEQESAQLGSVEKWRRRIASLVKPGRKKVAEYGDCLMLIRKDGNDKAVPRYAVPLTRWDALGPIGQAALRKAAQPLLCAPGDEEEVPCD